MALAAPILFIQNFKAKKSYYYFGNKVPTLTQEEKIQLSTHPLVLAEPSTWDTEDRKVTRNHGSLPHPYSPRVLECALTQPA